MENFLKNDLPFSVEQVTEKIGFVIQGMKCGLFTEVGFRRDINYYLEHARNRLKISSAMCREVTKNALFLWRKNPEQAHLRMTRLQFNVICFVLRERTAYLETFPRPDSAIRRIDRAKGANDCIFELSELVGFYTISRFSAIDNDKIVETIAKLELDNSGEKLLYSEATCYHLPGAKKNYNKLYFCLRGEAFVTNSGVHIHAFDECGYSQYYMLLVGKMRGNVVLMQGSNNANFSVVREYQVCNRAIFEKIDINSYPQLLKMWRKIRGLKDVAHLDEKITMLLPDGQPEFRVIYF
ncbi:hypothetical protein [Paraglaciecola marina]|uniref:hypothetical protein n=1 Tax=Paraglaciecola marina TaxID=2500157 RepID=UPI00105E8E5D|nr:hypothetical protein [Paraglaciecola marina]